MASCMTSCDQPGPFWLFKIIFSREDLTEKQRTLVSLFRNESGEPRPYSAVSERATKEVVDYVVSELRLRNMGPDEKFIAANYLGLLTDHLNETICLFELNVKNALWTLFSKSLESSALKNMAMQTLLLVLFHPGEIFDPLNEKLLEQYPIDALNKISEFLQYAGKFEETKEAARIASMAIGRALKTKATVATDNTISCG